MNIFIPLVIGAILGYLFKNKIKVDLNRLMSATLLMLVFLMGVEAGKVEINAINLFVASFTFAVLTMLGSLFFAVLLGGRLR